MRYKKRTKGIKKMKLNKEFVNAMLSLENEKGIKREQIIEVIKRTFIQAYIKYVLGGGDDAHVEAELDLDKPSIELFYVRKVIENDDDIQDDYLEISKEEALSIGPKNKVKVGEDFYEKVNLDEFMKKYGKKLADSMKQKINEIEKSILYDMYKDKIGEMITGIVEKSDENSTIVNIGRTSVVLLESQKIGHEKFEVGQQIKLYVKDVNVSSKHGAQILVSRSDKGFLRRLLEEEISEVYDGTVIIKDIARRAGERSKVSVYSNDPNVDPVGSCIGPNGARIQKVMGELFNGRDNERIDVIHYSDNPSIYIAEALKPAPIAGVKLDEANKEALMIVKSESKSLAIGRKGQNVSLASLLTGWKIKIEEENIAIENGIEFKPYEEVVAEDQRSRRTKEYELYLKSLSQLKGSEEKEDVATSIPSENEKVEESEPILEETNVEETKETAAPAKEEAKVEEPVVKETIVHQDVKTTRTLEELEKQLEIEKAREEKKANKAKRTARKDYVEEEKAKASAEETKQDENKPTYMSIYTDEELSALDAEDNYNDDYDDYDDDIDYDEYDDYYDDDEGR